MSDIERSYAFFAYASNDQSIRDTILDGVAKANGRNAIRCHFKPWEFNDISGRALIEPIAENINSSLFVIADITFLNLNVIYEIGYAIGLGKRVHLVRHRNMDGDKKLMSVTGLFDTIGYKEYFSSDSLLDILSSHMDDTPIDMGRYKIDRSAPIYLVEPPTTTEYSTTIISRIKKARYRYKSHSPGENLRLSTSEAIEYVCRASGIILSILSDEETQASEHNIKTMFVAGLSHGLAKPTLILCSNSVKLPLDIRDVVKVFSNKTQLEAAMPDFWPLVAEYLQTPFDNQNKDLNLLSSLSIGDPTAENEMMTLGNYYLIKNEFTRAISGEVNLAVGKKGSGKTALFVSIRDHVRRDKKNVVVDLKPESYQLIKLKEEILSLLDHGHRMHLITAFWEYLILLEIAYKLVEKDETIHRHDHNLTELYKTLNEQYLVNARSITGDFSERLLKLSKDIVSNFVALSRENPTNKLTSNQITEILYSHNIPDLRKIISKYLKYKKKTLVLFDNLDKSWAVTGVDEIDTLTFRCLIDAGRKVEREMQSEHLDFRCIIFVRNDVYEHLTEQSSDYGKEMRASLDWSDPDQLKEMLHMRLRSNLEKSNLSNLPLDFDGLWHLISVSHVFGEDSRDFIISRSLMRPRNVIKLFNHIRASASTFGREKLTINDYIKGLWTYSGDLFAEIGREIGDVFPEAKDILYDFIDCKYIFDQEELFIRFLEAKISEDRFEELTNFLLYNGVLGFIDNENPRFIYDFQYDLKRMRKKNESDWQSIKIYDQSSIGGSIGNQDNGW